MKHRDIRIRVVWLGVCALVIITICSLFFYFAVRVQREIRQSEQSGNLQDCVYLRSLIDDSLDAVNGLTLSVTADHLTRDMEQARDLDDYRRLGAYSLSRKIQNYIRFSPIIADIYVYYPQTGYVIGKNGAYPLHTYWASVHGVDEAYSYERWSEALFFTRTNGYDTIKSDAAVTVFSRFGSENSDQRLIVTCIDPEAIRLQLERFCADTRKAFAALVDSDGRVIAAAGDAARFVDAQTQQTLPIGDDHLSSTAESAVSGLSYLVVVSKTAAYERSDATMRLALALLLAAILCSAVLSYYLVRRSVTSLERVASRLAKGPAGHKNEVLLIDQAIGELLENQSTLTELARRQQITIGQSFLGEVLRQDPNDKKDPEMIAALYGLSLENACYCVIARRRGETNDAQRVTELLLALEDSVTLFWTVLEDVDVFLLNFDLEHAGRQTNFLESLRAISSPQAAFAASDIVDSSFGIMACWMQCAQALGCERLLPVGYMRQTAYHTDPYSTILEQLRKRLDQYDFSSADQWAEELYQQYVYDPDSFYFQCKKFLVIHALLPYCQQHGEDYLIRLSAAQTKEQWRAAFRTAISFIPQKPRISNSDIAARVRSTIDRQYSNPMLDLRMISDELSFSQSYLSRLFKEAYGLGISQYINQVRIEQAKQLIIHSQDNIKVIAMKVGFAGDAQFIRAFKRYENITPGNFRTTFFSGTGRGDE